MKFKLSDYSGKVVVLDFWGDWGPTCRAMYPHERALVAKMKNEPFALIGINSDRDKAKLKQRTKAENITWRSFWSGPLSTSGPISRAWGVRGWPTIYVLDDKGVIRYKNVRGSAIDKAVETLVAKVEGGSPGSTPSAKLREFTDSTGKFKIKARFVEFNEGKAVLEKEDGDVLKVVMTKLSKEDQKYIQELLRSRLRLRP